jgi:hypothetical protein
VSFVLKPGETIEREPISCKHAYCRVSRAEILMRFARENGSTAHLAAAMVALEDDAEVPCMIEHRFVVHSR